MDATPHPEQPAPAQQYLPPPAPAATRRPGFRKFALHFALGAAAGGLLGVLGTQVARLQWDWLPWHAVAAPSVGLMLLFGTLSLWPNVLLHEAGHALAGMARGMRPVAFGLGPWRWERGGDRWRVRKAGHVRGIGGFAALIPSGDRGLSRFDHAVYLAGGPLANLLTAAIAAASLPLAVGSPAVVALLLGWGICALLLGLLNLVPFHSHGWRSDGRGLLGLLSGSATATVHLQTARVMALSRAGVRPRDWPASLVPAAAMPHTASPMAAVSAGMLRLAWAMDRNDAATAGACATVLRDRIHEVPAAFQPHVAVTIAAFAARIQRDPQLLAAWRPLCDGGLLDLSVLRDWLDAELAVARGDDAAAEAGAIAQARASLPRAPDPVTALQLAEYLDALEIRVGIRAAQAHPTGASVKLA